MKADSAVILLIVFAIISIAIGGIIGEMNNNYSINASTSFEDKYNFANEINSTVTDMKLASEQAGKETGWLSVLSGASAVLQATITTITLILGVPGYTIKIIRGVAVDIGLPPILADVIFGLLIVMILVAIVFMVIRFIRGDQNY